MSNDLNYKLDKEELEILEDIENGNYVSLKETNPKEFKKEMEIAKISAKNTIERLTKKKTYTKQTSKPVASEASKILKSPTASKASKAVAGSALSQTKKGK